MSVMPDPQQHAALVYCCFAVFRFNKVYLKIGNLQSRKTKVPHSDWWFTSSTLCGWKDHFRNNSPFCTVSRSSQLLVYLLGFGPSLFLSIFLPIQQGLFKLRKALLLCLLQSVTLMLMPKAIRSLLQTCIFIA